MKSIIFQSGRIHTTVAERPFIAPHSNSLTSCHESRKLPLISKASLKCLGSALGLGGFIFDISQNIKTYKNDDSPFSKLVGRDATPFFKDRDGDAWIDWLAYFKKTYPVVGRLLDEDDSDDE